MTEKECLWTLALALTPGLGPAGFQKIIKLAKTPKRAFSLEERDLISLGLRKEAQKALKDPEKALRRAEAELEGLQKYKAHLVSIFDEEYPSLLREIATPPPILFYRGKLRTLRYPLAIVGSRAATSYGKEIAFSWSKELAQKGIEIISGLAVGIDACAHRGALEADGYTLAILGCGLDQKYPRENVSLAEEIVSRGGALVTEFPLGTEPRAPLFPIRNRIISGLSLGVLVVEASPRSGSLITARCAGEQGREVMAVPGSIFSRRSHGCHRLIREGALLLDRPEQILETLGVEKKTSASTRVKELTLSPLEAKVLGCLEPYPIHVDDLVQKTGLAIAQVSSILLALELKGLVRGLMGNFYLKVKDDEEGTDHC